VSYLLTGEEKPIRCVRASGFEIHRVPTLKSGRMASFLACETRSCTLQAPFLQDLSKDIEQGRIVGAGRFLGSQVLFQCLLLMHSILAL
jgi:hypothetical protein